MVAGVYFDPWHGGCLRRIVHIDADTYGIHGVYGRDAGLPEPEGVEYDPEPSAWTNRYWFATCRIVSTEKNQSELHVDFTAKPNKKRKHYTATHDADERVIKWDDGNRWKQLYYHRAQLVDCHVWLAEEAARRIERARCSRVLHQSSNAFSEKHRLGRHLAPHAKRLCTPVGWC